MEAPIRRRRPTRILLVLCALALACDPGDPLERVRVQQDRSRDWAGSLEPLREMLDARPDDPEVHYRYGLALIGNGNFTDAIWSLKKAMRSPEWVTRAGIPLARVFATLGSHRDAIDVYTQVLERDPGELEALVGRGMARVRARTGYEEALADADRALELEPDSTEGLVLRALSLLALERAEEAGPVLEDLERVFQDESLGLHGSPGFCSARATFAKEKGDADLAEQRYEKCLSLFPTDPMVLQQSIAFFDEGGRRDRSEEILAAALLEEPADASVRADLVGRLLARGADDEAEALVRAATELPDPRDAAAGFANVALLELSRGDAAAAAEAFGRALQLNPVGDPELAFGYADALVVAGRHDEALAVVADIEVPAFRSLIEGRVALARGDPEAAVASFEQGVRLWPDNAIARYYLAVAAEQADRFPTAVEHYRYAMRVDVRATDAYLRLARLHAAMGDVEQALAMLSFQPGGRPEEATARLLQLEWMTRSGEALPESLLTWFAHPDRVAAGSAAIARGLRAGRGAAQAADFLQQQDRLDLGEPRHAEALAELVEALVAAERAGEGVAVVGTALERHPDVAVFHALRGRALASGGGSKQAARAAYDRALALDAEEPRALAGLAQLEADRGDAAAALALYDRALAVDPDDRASARAAASQLRALGRSEEAETRLEALLRDRPDDAAAALSLAELRVARDADPERTRRLAQRAVSFRGGAEAEALLASLGGEARPAGAAPTP